MTEEGHSHISEKLVRLLDRLAEICQREFSGLNAQQFNWKLLPDKWSISECLHHSALIAEDFLSKTENSIFIKIAANKEKSLISSGFIGKSLINKVSIREDNSIRKIKKCPKKLRPDLNPELRGMTILERFLVQIDELKRFIEKSKELNLVSNKIKIFSVPIFKLRLGDFMIYTVAHIERHVVQAQKVLMEDNFP